MNTQTERKKFVFAIYLSAVALVLSLVEMTVNYIEVYGFELPVVCFGLTWVIVHIAITHRKHYWYDYLVAAILFVVWLTSYIQVATFYMRYTGPDEYWTANYMFPCIIQISHYIAVDSTNAPVSDLINGMQEVNYDTLCLNFLASAVLFVSTLTAKVCFTLKNKANSEQSTSNKQTE